MGRGLLIIGHNLDLSGLRAALSADPDDHDGGPARRRADDGGYGVGSEIRQPLGYAIVGGLALSQILTSTRRQSSISASTGCSPGSSGKGGSKRPPATPSHCPPNDRQGRRRADGSRLVCKDQAKTSVLFERKRSVLLKDRVVYLSAAAPKKTGTRAVRSAGSVGAPACTRSSAPASPK